MKRAIFKTERKIFEMKDLKICIKGAGEMASGIALLLYTANFKNIIMLEKDNPLAVRRDVSFCTAVRNKKHRVENVPSRLVETDREMFQAWDSKEIAVMVDPFWKIIRDIRFDVVIDALIAKKNIGTTKDEAELVLGLGPGFTAGEDTDIVIETNRGHHLGRIITQGMAAKNTGIPGNIDGYTTERVLRAPSEGKFESRFDIGDSFEKNDIIGSINGDIIKAKISGILRGLIEPGIIVEKNCKVGDIDPRGDISFCGTVSDKSRTIGSGVLAAVLNKFNH